MNNENLALILTGSGTEFFAVNGVAYAVHNRTTTPLEEAPQSVTDKLISFMTADNARVRAYKEMAGDSLVDQMSQCVKCMFSNLDGTPDFDPNGRFINAEFVKCDKRSTCKFYGVGCKKLTASNGNEISKSELRVLELYDREEKDIAEELFLSPQTVRRHTQNIRTKTGIRKDKVLALWAYNKGIINQSRICAY